MLPNWSDYPVCVVASGVSAPSILSVLKECAANRFMGKMRFIVINKTHAIAQWADILYAADSAYWMVSESARTFAGLQVVPDHQCKKHAPRAHCIPILTVDGKRVDKMVFKVRNRIGGGGFSGFQALNVAIQTGSKLIYLAGYDFQDKHWHNDHGGILRNPDRSQLNKWCKLLDAQYDSIVEQGIQVFNLSDASQLKRYPYANCNDVYKRFAALPLSSILERAN